MKILLGIALSVWLSGCSALMEIERPPYREASVIQIAADRSQLVEKLGRPDTSYDDKELGKGDSWRFDPDGHGPWEKAGIASFDVVADVLTIGLWELVGVGYETASWPKPTTYTVKYGSDDKVASVDSYK